MPKWLKYFLKIISGIIILIVLLLAGITLYIYFNKARVLKLVNTELNKNVDGTLTIGDVEPQFFKGFPDISLTLKNVILRDKRFAQHHHTLLDAKDFNISVNAKALLSGTISINHIDISNAAIDLYTDSTGYSNTSVFKKNPKSTDTSKSNSSSSTTELKQFSLTNVGFKVNDQSAKKLFDFAVNHLNGKMSYPDTGWSADFHLNVLVKSFAFNTKNGSFIKNRLLDGDFTATGNKTNGRIIIKSDELDIGDDPFKIDATFETGKTPSTFSIHVADDKLLWRSASDLLAQNISLKLNQFNISKPMAVTAIIAGSFSGGGDPFIYVTAKINSSTVTTPAAQINDCSFDGVFTNNFQNGKGLSDDNSVIRLTKLTGNYNHLPFAIDTGSIINLNMPVATGNFRSSFPVSDLNYMLGDKIATFSNGTANMSLRYKAHIIDYQLNKPIVSGGIHFKNTDINYIPDNLLLKNTSLSLYFIGNDLVLKNIRVQSGRSILNMNGRINNFLNFYYTAPEKIFLSWQINSPQLYLGEFLGLLKVNNSKSSSSSATAKRTSARNSNSTNVVKQLDNVLAKGNAEMHLKVANLHYNKFLATDVNADLLTSQNGFIIRSVNLKHAGGSLKLSGLIKRDGATNKVYLSTDIYNVNVTEFFNAFDNFGLTDLTAQNLRGFLSAKTNITGVLNGNGAIVPHSFNGTLDVNLKNGALVNFKPLVSVGKFAFPFRDLKNISIPNLDASFELHGDLITIKPMQISSSVLNVDVAGVYGLTRGTNIALDIPLRNPKKDTSITNKDDLLKKRYKGIVVHILAKDDGTGKIKIGLNKNHK